MKVKGHLTKEGLLEICELRDQMNGNRNVRKRDIGEIRAILNQPDEHILAHQNQTHLTDKVST